ncbi:hypothetical protein [Trichocoleus sp. FACHB-262]|uniref:hypothetical protein n=1 Tax=Trichocoleus sp. FACHB-262 TaxID=2692869 RepID=UPI0016882241|nr:hypothetical protein [Trichocoleus sp. FACHB-262]MBD2122271.1 hypothetical protein [Trichocoleus sp. FACHB-262]
MKFHRLSLEERLRWQPGIAAIEQMASYPLGDDFFQLDHGSDYFAFFDRLGSVNYYVALDGDRVAAVGAGVLRQVKTWRAEALQPAWYLCDLKVNPLYQRQQLSMRILSHAIADGLPNCVAGYTISMNTEDGSASRWVRVLERFDQIAFCRATTLGIYSCDAMTMQKLEPILNKHRGPITYLSLQGVKDLRLQSTGQILPLLHVQWGVGKVGAIAVPQPGYTHMFCAPTEDALATELSRLEVYPSATASVVSHGMQSDWQFILTSDI